MRTPHLLRLTVFFGLAVSPAVALTSPSSSAAEQRAAPHFPGTHLRETGVPPGQTEHGVFISSDAADPHYRGWRRAEYWATSSHWKSVARDRRGAVSEIGFGGPEGYAVFVPGGSSRTADGHVTRKDPVVSRSHPRPTPPFPGYGAPANREAISTGWLTPVAGAPKQTIAGFTGTLYAQFDSNQDRVVNGTTTVVVQDGTLQPLLRESKLLHPKPHQPAYDLQDRLVSRELTPTATAAVEVTQAAYARTVRGWLRQVRAARARRGRDPHRTQTGRRPRWSRGTPAVRCFAGRKRWRR